MTSISVVICPERKYYRLIYRAAEGGRAAGICVLYTYTGQGEKSLCPVYVYNQTKKDCRMG